MLFIPFIQYTAFSDVETGAPYQVATNSRSIHTLYAVCVWQACRSFHIAMSEPVQTVLPLNAKS